MDIKKEQMKYNIQYNIGKTKYVINFYDGVKKHKDNSNFYDMRIFSNKKELNKFEKSLLKLGYLKERVI